jgi:transposase
VIADSDIDTLDPEQLRQALRALAAEVAHKDELIAQREREAAFKRKRSIDCVLEGQFVT